MTVTTAIVAIIMLAIITEYLTNVFKPLIPNVEYPIPLLISMLIGVGLALLTGVDALLALQFDVAVPLIGQIVTGLIVSGGSTAVHELLEKLKSGKSQIK